MCPGGTVVAAASEAGGVVTNGMSHFARDGENANSRAARRRRARRISAATHPLAGRALPAEMGARARSSPAASDYRAPAQTRRRFSRRARKRAVWRSVARDATRPGVTPADLAAPVCPRFAVESMREALRAVGPPPARLRLPRRGAHRARKRARPRPVRIPRDEDAARASALGGLYPCGEGAGYAGGILSAAVDGVKQAGKRFCAVSHADAFSPRRARRGKKFFIIP